MNRYCPACVLLCSIAFPFAAHANPADYIYMPAVEYGEREIDFKAGANTPQPGAGSASGTSIGLGYGIQEHWFTEIYLKRERSGNQNAPFQR
jgi:hypothetical protein